MTKTKRLLSAVITVIMLLSMLTSFNVASAGGAADSDLKGASAVNTLIYNPFKGLKTNPGYGVSVPSGIIFVCSEWNGVEKGKTVYMKYLIDGVEHVYKAQMGINAFADGDDAIVAVGKDNLVLKYGAGTYEDDVKLEYNGLKFYGSYAGVDPNASIPGEINVKTIAANAARDPDYESVLSGVAYEFTVDSNNILFDGFKVTGLDASTTNNNRTKTFKIAYSAKITENIYFQNNIFDSCKRAFDANRGYNNGVYIKNNRFVNCNDGQILQGGGGMSDIIMEYNYFENCSSHLFWLNSCGAYSAEALLSFSNNTVYKCAKAVYINYDNSNMGTNLDYKRIENNVFTECGSAQKSIVHASYYYEYFKNASDTDPTVITDTGSKTFISKNTFYNIPDNVTAVNLVGGQNFSGADINYSVSVIGNRFMLEGKKSYAVKSTVDGIVDASNNFFGMTVNGAIQSVSAIGDYFESNEDTILIKLPYYTDFDMTKLGGAIALKVYNKADLSDFDDIKINNDKAQIICDVVSGYTEDEISLKGLFTTSSVSDAIDVDCIVFSDFLLTKPTDDMSLKLMDEITRGYLVVTHIPTGMTIKYSLVVSADIDKTKTEIREITYGVKDILYEDADIDGTVYNIDLPSNMVNFPFELLVSPGAKYKVYTDPEYKTVYSDKEGYIAPDRTLSLFIKVTAADGKTTEDYTFNINRPGSTDYDARIFSVVSPEQNILLFNNKRKTISYTPFALTSAETFDFKVSEDATYKIYKKYDEKTGKLSEVVSTADDIKELPIGDGLGYYYVNVESKYGYSQMYTLIIYNDVRSTDNVITGITGLTSGIEFCENNHIEIEASVTLTAINAHFETNPFADIKVYPTADKTYALTPSSTYEFINNREVEIRTFQLGIENKVAYYWVDVTSEVGETNSYTITITKPADAVSFTDISGHWAEKYIKDVSNLGVINGYLNEQKGTYYFSPDANASRQEMAALLCRMMGIDALSFKNETLGSVYADSSDIADWSYNYIKGAYFLGIMVGSKNADGDTEFLPDNKITRQEFFQAVSNLMKLDVNAAKDYDLSKFSDAKQISGWALPATKAVVKAGIIEGSDGKLNPKSNITRAEITKIISIINTISKDVK